MGYEKEMKIEGYNIIFEYSYDRDGYLVLDEWSAFDNNDKEVQITDQQASQDIENEIERWLEDEWSENSHNYEQDYMEFIADEAYETYRESLWED